jgi:hypothetical protein
MNVKFLTQGNNGLSLIGFEPTRSAWLFLYGEVIVCNRQYLFFNCFNDNSTIDNLDFALDAVQLETL